MSQLRARGFTLIEMVIAFAILALTLTVLFGSFESALSRTRHDARVSESTLIAESLLARVGIEWPVSNLPQRGSWHEYTYEIDTESTLRNADGHPATIPTVRVTVRVRWHESAGDQQVDLATRKVLPSGAS